MAYLSEDYIQGLLEDKIRFGRRPPNTQDLPGFCPFHKSGNERSPSFYMYIGPPTAKKSPGMSYCHTCGEGWSLSALLKKLGINSKIADTVIDIANERRPKKRHVLANLSFELFRLPESLLGVFDYCPKLLLDAGFTKDTLRYFDIGFDKRAKRVTFPIRDHMGNLVGVSGRTVVGDHPRYKVYRSEFNGFHGGYNLDKSKVVWNLDKIYPRAMRFGLDSPIIICEGFKAAMWVHQAGFKNSVALLGDACSMEQRVLLSRVANEAVVFLDHDNAGIKATHKLHQYLRGPTLRMAEYPDFGLSPDDLSPKQIQLAVNEAKPFGLWRKNVSKHLEAQDRAR